MTNTEQLWQEISIAALLGTQRKPYHPDALEGELGGMLRAAGLEGERGLLFAASVTALHRRAGRLPEPARTILPPASPRDEWPRCTPQMAAYLKQILLARKPALLHEWVSLAAQRQVRVSEEMLPALFSQTKALLPFRQKLLPVLGQRGHWLAAQNPDWSAFFPYTDPLWWEEGTRKQRLLFLSDVRASDPARAREMLQTTWADETISDRLAFLPILAERLSMADEPFLEQVLDERRKDLRQAAAQLLSSLTESRFVQRMTARALPYLSWKSSLLRSSVEITLPETCDAAMQRDGITSHPAAAQTFDERAAWLRQMIAAVPPETWTVLWSRRPTQILEALRKEPFEDAVVQGLSEAALHHHSAEWLEALAWREYRRGPAESMLILFQKLPDSVQETITLTLLDEHPTLSYETNAALCLAACRHPWGEMLSQAVLNSICWTLRRSDLPPWRWEKLLRDIAPYFHAHLLAEAVERLRAALGRTATQNPPAQTLLAVLEFRLEMHRAFTSD